LKERFTFKFVVGIWRAIPLKLVFLLVLLSLFLRNPKEGVPYKDQKAEYYPFSNYPMYSQFDEQDYYVYLADQDGEPLPSKATFRTTTPKIKKFFKGELETVARKLGKKKSEVDGDDLEAVAIKTLKSLDDAVADHPRVAALEELQLIYVDLRRVDGKIRSDKRKIATIPVEEVMQ